MKTVKKPNYWTWPTTYPGEIYCCFDEKDLEALYKDIGAGEPDSTDDSLGRFIALNGENRRRAWIIFINIPLIHYLNPDNDIIIADAVAHETMHYIQEIQRYVETKFDDETEAYLLGSTLTSVLLSFNQYLKIPGKRKRK